MKQTIEMTVAELRSDHRNMIMLLDVLDSEAHRLRASTDADYDLLREVITYMMEYSDIVHHPKEDLLYGYLQFISDSLDESLQKIEEDHSALADATNRIYADIPTGQADPEFDRVAMAERLAQYSRDLRKHMCWEEKTLFEFADSAKENKKWTDILARHDLPDDPLFGKVVNKRFSKLFNHIQRHLVWDSQQYFT